jgi:hypothetical protein
MVPIPSRPPVGLLVEGKCEYGAVHEILRRGVSADHGELPVYDCRGGGSLRKRLEEHLVYISKTGALQVLVCLDLVDVTRERPGVSCKDLLAELQARCNAWLEYQQSHGGMPQLPSEIVVVFQVPKFEAWVVADPDRPVRQGGFKNRPSHTFAEVDSEIRDHVRWLHEAVQGGYRKESACIQRLFIGSHPARMASHSRSFRKFWKHVMRAYGEWAMVTGRAVVER